MKRAYPVIFTPLAKEGGYMVTLPDFDGTNTHGNTMPEAIEMARDAMGIMGLCFEDEGKALPTPSPLDKIKTETEEILSFVDVDFAEYRRRNELRTVKKNCTLPSWLNTEAERAHVNFSAVLQNALKQELHLA
ncbi:MAG: type II toxin-antitoxin system HicB family antitoxin [Oscillospiraceae bacterium]|jgi:predicted RNase H-like HicB family nuclease|nr:type II toxin-antitoxin system HicB family antitoxin [Oscillospiraceae bacterium]